MAKMNKFEGSKKDMAQDAKLAKKYKMSPKEYEKSAVDAKHDKQKSMAGLKHGGSMYASGGKVAKRDTPPRGGENYSGMGKPYTPGGKRPSLRKDIKYGMKQDSKRAKQDYKAPEGMTEFGTAKAATTAPTARPMPPARPAVMPMARPAVMPVRPGMAKGGMAKDGVASKGKTSTKMVKMASGGSFRAADGIASKGKTKGRMC